MSPHTLPLGCFPDPKSVTTRKSFLPPETSTIVKWLLLRISEWKMKETCILAPTLPFTKGFMPSHSLPILLIFFPLLRVKWLKCFPFKLTSFFASHTSELRDYHPCYERALVRLQMNTHSLSPPPYLSTPSSP